MKYLLKNLFKTGIFIFYKIIWVWIGLQVYFHRAMKHENGMSNVVNSGSDMFYLVPVYCVGGLGWIPGQTNSAAFDLTSVNS